MFHGQATVLNVNYFYHRKDMISQKNDKLFDALAALCVRNEGVTRYLFVWTWTHASLNETKDLREVLRRLALEEKHPFAYNAAPYQCVVTCGTVPQTHTVVCAGGQ